MPAAPFSLVLALVVALGPAAAAPPVRGIGATGASPKPSVRGRIREPERAPARQPAPVLVRVIDGASRSPLPNAEVIDLASGSRRFTNADGEAGLTWPTAGPLRLRVRQVGFQPVERALDRPSPQPSDSAAAGAAPVVVALTRVAFVLPNAFTRADARCGERVDSTSALLTAAVLEQLRMGAERYEEFRKAYPFRVEQERRTLTLNGDSVAQREETSTEVATSDEWGDEYRPGRIIQRTPSGFSVPILYVSALASPAFWENHCFAVRGLDSLGGERVLRVEFSPARGVKGAEWAGRALVDSATSVLRRVDFHLAGLRDGDMPRRLAGYTTFRSPSPFVFIPDSTVVHWWRYRGPDRDGRWGVPDVQQVVHVQSLTFVNAPPLRTPDQRNR